MRRCACGKQIKSTFAKATKCYECRLIAGVRERDLSAAEIERRLTAARDVRRAAKFPARQIA